MASSERLRTAGLDGLRAVAALSVLCFHAWLYGFEHPYSVTRNSVFDRVVFEFRLGLVFFFVLSGFLLYRAFARAALSGERRVDVRRYARRRVARIVPAYWLATIGAVALLWGGTGTPGIRLPAVSDLALFGVFGQNYSPDTIMRLNPVTWTLCVEAVFYVLLPLLGALAWRLGPRARKAQVVLVAALIPLGLAWNALVHANGWSIIASKALPAYLPYFACGMLLAVWAGSRPQHAGRSVDARATAALVLGGFALVAADACWHATASPAGAMAVIADVPAAVGFALVVGGVATGGGMAARWASARPLAWVGLVSYGVYLWHVPLILLARRMDVLPSSYPLRLLLMVPPVLLVAAASWYLVERPLIARASRTRAGRDDTRRRERRGQPQLEAHVAP
jgi:peptidoglycan/LPS O-acetylase OafA/YrhL